MPKKLLLFIGFSHNMLLVIARSITSSNPNCYGNSIALQLGGRGECYTIKLKKGGKSAERKNFRLLHQILSPQGQLKSSRGLGGVSMREGGAH